jgi:hypothetical protein
MDTSPFLTSLGAHRDPKLLWPVAAVASVIAHGVALALVRTVVLQTPNLPEGTVAPLPIQLVDLPPDAPTPDAPAFEPVASDLAIPDLPVSALVPAPPPAQPPTDSPVTLPQGNAAIAPQPIAPPLARPPVSQAPPRPVPPMAAAPAVSVAPPAPPVPAPPVVPPPVAAPPVPDPPGGQLSVGAPVTAPPAPATAVTTPETGRGGQVVPVGLRLNPSGRDIPDTAPQLAGDTAMAMRPMASGCGLANLDALLAGMVSTSVQMQIRVETSGEISAVRLLQGTGSAAVDDLIGCVVRQRLRLQPASSAGVPQLTDAFILDARVEF